MNKKDLEMRAQAREAIIRTLKEGYNGYYCDLHDHVFNTEFYIIGVYEAKEALNEYDIFEAIKKVQTYEKDNFREAYTDLSDPEKLVNMLWYIIGEEVLFELTNGIEAWDENWNNQATDESNNNILKGIVKKEALQKAEIKIKKEMNRIGFIDDSDGITNRFLDSLTRDLIEEALRDINYEKEDEIEELQEEVLQEIKNFMKKHYKYISKLEGGNYIAFYYKADKEFKDLNEFYNHFAIGE